MMDSPPRRRSKPSMHWHPTCAMDEAAENEFSDDANGPQMIGIPNRRGRVGRASHTQSTTTGDKGLKSTTCGYGGQPGVECIEPQTSHTETLPASSHPTRKHRASSPATRTDPARTEPRSALGDTSLKLVFAAVCLLFALLVGSYMYISSSNTRLHQLNDDLVAKMLLNNAAIERLENDVRLLKSRGRPEKDHSVETNPETNQDVKYMRSDIDELRLVTTGLPQKLQGIASMKTTIDDIRRQVNEDISRIIARIGNMSKEQKEYLRDKIEPNMFNKWATTLAIIMIVLLQAGSVFAIYVLCSKGQGYGGQADPGYGTRNNRNKEVATQTTSRRQNAILNRIPRNRSLQRLVCVISLEPSTRALHQQITESVLTGLSVPQRPEVTELLVSSNEDMLEIPAATVNLLFIHFSEQHVILEKPGLALGDRHVTTFQAVRQIGGGLAIVYIRDPESRDMQGNDLYNRNIPVAESPELQRLCDAGAFFSTYDRLTQHQTASLQRFIAEYLDKF